MELRNVPQKINIVTPFASQGDAYSPISEVAVEDAPSFQLGFPAAFSAPKKAGVSDGKFVTRGQMNAIGRLATNNDFVRMCGMVNTFDPKFCASIGGYPKNAVLDLLDGTNLYHVMSLHDNNTVNFILDGVDNVNWAYCNTVVGGEGDDGDRSVMFTIPDIVGGVPPGETTVAGEGTFNNTVGMFVAPTDGVLVPEGSFDYEGWIIAGTSTNNSHGFVVALADVTGTNPPYSSPTASSSTVTVIYYKGNGTVDSFPRSPSVPALVSGHKYVGWLIGGNCKISNSTLAFRFRSL